MKNIYVESYNIRKKLGRREKVEDKENLSLKNIIRVYREREREGRAEGKERSKNKKKEGEERRKQITMCFEV